LPIQGVKTHKDNKAHSMAERTRQRQYIGGIIVYILKRQGGSNLRIFWEVHNMSLIQKVNQMRQYIGGVRAKTTFYPRFAYTSRQCLLIKL
jgi:hypothetical protein